ncbi:hypothetical protein NOC27_2830 [Nitrosococcus oceani AFC27]|nr:hypothetical protein NOC27_2830 [Nitrosococcus oceani AFC27]
MYTQHLRTLMQRYVRMFLNKQASSKQPHQSCDGAGHIAEDEDH